MKSEVGEERDAFVHECDLKAVIVPRHKNKRYESRRL